MLMLQPNRFGNIGWSAEFRIRHLGEMTSESHVFTNLFRGIWFGGIDETEIATLEPGTA
jgi:hypothetical protein